jgi:DNA-binding XRE family transcriptional regulator
LDSNLGIELGFFILNCVEERMMDLATTRAMKKKTQWDLRKLTGINQSKISLMEHGHIVPNVEEKAVIARALGVHVDEICWPEQTPNHTQGVSC